MFLKNWKKEILFIPNLLSLFRLMVVPIYIKIYWYETMPHHYLIAGCLIVLSCITDMLDGKIARRYHMVTTLGKILDPLADKITQFSLILCLSLNYPVLRFLMAVFFIKEIFQLTIGAIYIKKGKILTGALLPGKICTTVLFVSLSFLVFFPAIEESMVETIAFINIGFLLLSFLAYAGAYWGKGKHFEDLTTN